MVSITINGLNSFAIMEINGIQAAFNRVGLYNNYNVYPITYVIPKSATYRLINTSATTIQLWLELR